MNKTLTGIKVLVTRPAHQAAALCKLIADYGGVAICFPTIEITASNDPETAIAVLANIEHYDIGIFISTNAVDWTMKLLGDKKPLLQRLLLISIGTATTESLVKALSTEGNSMLQTIVTNTGNDSRSLIKLDVLSAAEIADRKIIIFRGRGGEELLASTLKERGAQVDYAEIYQRRCPKYDKDHINSIWAISTPDIVIVTSNNGLQNLVALLNEEQREILFSRQLLVIGSRMLDLAMTFGFSRKPIVADEASDQGILETAIRWTDQNLKR